MFNSSISYANSTKGRTSTMAATSISRWSMSTSCLQPYRSNVGTECISRTSQTRSICVGSSHSAPMRCEIEKEPDFSRTSQKQIHTNMSTLYLSGPRTQQLMQASLSPTLYLNTHWERLSRTGSHINGCGYQPSRGLSFFSSGCTVLPMLWLRYTLAVLSMARFVPRTS